MTISIGVAESFPLIRYTAAMYPPRVSNAEVKAVIRTIATTNALPSGAAVRRALETRYESRGGVARIYRLLAEERRRLTPPVEPGSVESLAQELQAMQGRAERAEERESSHQNRWAAEIDQLRQKVAALEPLAHQARIKHETSEHLRHRLQAAEQRAARLEQQLIEIQAREGKRHTSSQSGA
jgi:hypothetical protein